MTTFAHALASALSRHSTQAFGLMGNGNAHLIDALHRHGVRLSEVRHEAATVASADAYMRVSGKLAIATTTYGAGFTNTLTALTEAAQARTPLLLVTGDEPSSNRRPWDIDQELAAAAIGVRTYSLSPLNIEATVEQAVARALHRRCPVVIAIPYDYAGIELSKPATVDQVDQEIDLNDPATMQALAAATLPNATAAAEPLAEPQPIARPATAATSIELTAAVQLLSGAKRPIVIAGRGAWVSGARGHLNEIAEMLGAITSTTALARGMFRNDRFDLGVTGGFGQHAAMQLIQEADVALVVGASLNQFTMSFGELFGEGTKVIRIDVDQVDSPKSNRNVEQLLLRGDAKTVLGELLGGLSRSIRSTPLTNWREQVTGLEAGGKLRVLDRGTMSSSGLCDDGRLDPRAVASRLAELMPEDRHVTSDGGHFIAWANMFWPVASPERMIMVGTAYQTIGLGIATVAGVAAAAPDSTVVVTTGDGGALMALADLETSIRTARSCVIVVWNDEQYGAEVHLYGLMGLDQRSMMIPQVNFAAMATALGATGVVVEDLADLEALTEWREHGATGTILLDCRVSRSVVAPYQREIQRVNGVHTDR